jgi:hypothetical protein
MVSLATPVSAGDVDDTLIADEDLAAYAENGDDFGELGQALAQELVNGGPTPLWTTLSSQLVAERAGTSDPSVDGAVVVRSWTRSEDADADPADLRATTSLVQGLLSGLGQAGVPAVGVEATSDDTSVEVFREQGVSSVDDIDTAAGRIALAFLLAGGEPGHYGVKDGASDGVAPPLESLPALASD